MADTRVPQSYIDSLKIEEGDTSYIYLDTSNKATSGTGHLLSKQEYKDYGIVGWAKKKLKGISYHMAVNKDKRIHKEYMTIRSI